LALEPRNGGLGRAALGHLHEAKASRAAGVPVGNDVNLLDLAIRLKELAQVSLSGAKRHIADINIHETILYFQHMETIARSSEQDAGAKRTSHTEEETARQNRGITGSVL
jgi:hypothetical protein